MTTPTNRPALAKAQRITDQHGFIYIPDWMQMLVLVCMVLGFITLIIGTIAAIWWLVKHVHFT